MKKRIGLFVSLMVVFAALTGCKHDFGKNNEKIKVTIGQVNFEKTLTNARAAGDESTFDPNEFEYMVIRKDSKGNADVGLNASSININNKISYETLSELSFSLQPDSYSFTLDVYSPSLDDFTDYENVTSLVFTKTISLDITADMTDFALTFDLEKAENAMGLLNLYYYLGTTEKIQVSYKIYKSSDYMSGKRSDTDCVMEVSVSEQSDKENDYLTTNFPLPALDESYIITGNVLYEEDGILLPLRKTEIVKVLPGKFVDVNFYDSSYGQSEAEKIYSVKLNVVGPDGNPLVTKDTTDSDWNTNICRTQLEGCDFAYSEATVEIKSDKESFMELPILENQTVEGETYYFYGWYFDKESKIPAFNTSFIDGQCGGDTGRFSEDSTYLELSGVDLHGNVPMLYPKWRKSYKLYAVGEMQWDETVRNDVVYVNAEGTNVKEKTLDGKYVYELTVPETKNYYLEGFYYDEEFTKPLSKDVKYDYILSQNVPVYLVNDDYNLEGDVYVYAKYEIQLAYLEASWDNLRTGSYSSILGWDNTYKVGTALGNYSNGNVKNTVTQSISPGNAYSFDFENVNGDVYYLNVDEDSGYIKLQSNTNDNLYQINISDCFGIYSAKLGTGTKVINEVITPFIYIAYHWCDSNRNYTLKVDAYNMITKESNDILTQTENFDYNDNVNVITGDSDGNIYVIYNNTNIITLNSDSTYESLPEAEDLSEIVELDDGSVVTDASVIDDSLYIITKLMSVNSSSVGGSTGALIKIDLDTFTVDPDFNAFGKANRENNFFGGDSDLLTIAAPLPNETDAYFIGPYKMVAVTPKKLYILEEGCTFSYLDPNSVDGRYNGMYKHISRIVSVDLETATMSVIGEANVDLQPLPEKIDIISQYVFMKEN